MRLFIAVNFEADVVGRLLEVQDRLRAVADGGNFSRPENLHLTLAFLGEVEPDRAGAAGAAMDRTAFAPMDLVFDRVGCFPRRGGGLWWAGLGECPGLRRAQAGLCRALKREGFWLERREWKPHVTLARQVIGAAESRGAVLLGAPIPAHAGHMSLMLSQRVGGALTYTELYRTPSTDFSGGDQPCTTS